MRTVARALILVVGLNSPVVAETIGVGAIEIHKPWVRASLGGAPNSAAYMRIETTAAEPDRLVGGSTPVAGRVELHTHVMEGGIAKMRPVAAIEVAPGAPAVLAPGGLHVMLVGLTRPLEEGTTVPLTLRFETAGEVTFDVPVEGLRGGMSHGEMGHDEMGQGEMGHGGGSN